MASSEKKNITKLKEINRRKQLSRFETIMKDEAHDHCIESGFLMTDCTELITNLRFLFLVVIK